MAATPDRRSAVPARASAAVAVSGRQFVLENAGARAELGSLAAVLRSLSVDGIHLTEPIGTDVIAPMGCGIVLAPWPNRVRDGVWQLDGQPQQLDITEPPRHNAIHGLLRNTGYRLLEQTPSSVTLGALIAPQHGWPFLLDTSVRYELEADGLTVTHGVQNLSSRRAPWAVGAHPYFRVGDVPVDQLTVTLTAAVRIQLDERSNAAAEHPVDAPDSGGPGDLRAGRLLAGLTLDSPYGQLANRDGRADVAWLTAPDGSSTTLWADAAFGWIQAYTPAEFPRPAGTGLAVALEPMTGPPDALNSGTGLIWLEPGESWSASWGVRYAQGDLERTQT
ncbi:MAG: aldose 1-epimerase family protein [Pseudolysinimonas sp.]